MPRRSMSAHPRIELRAQFMRDDCQELILQAIGGFGAGACRLFPLEQLVAGLFQPRHVGEGNAQPLLFAGQGALCLMRLRERLHRLAVHAVHIGHVPLLILEPREEQKVGAVGEVDRRQQQHRDPVLVVRNHVGGNRAGCSCNHVGDAAPEEIVLPDLREPSSR
jgi:hypothetical protein